MEIIAEIGKNFVTTEYEAPHFVLLHQAELLIDAAKKCGVDTVKFQVHADDEIHPSASIVSPHFNQDRMQWVKRNTYPADFWWQIKEYCRENDIRFLATPMSRGAAILLNEDVGVDRWKIGSGDILDFVLLDYVRDTNKPIIMSSGMHTFEELKKAHDFIAEKCNDITILHCVSRYPCPVSELNLATIWFLMEKFPRARIGFSDHSLGIEAPLMALQMRAQVIEKHFTLDRNFWGPDHKVSLIPSEMKELVNRIKTKQYLEPTFEALGVRTKFLQDQEAVFRPVFQKGLYASRDITKNEMLVADMIYAMRPKLSDALPADDYSKVIGTISTKDIKEYESVL